MSTKPIFAATHPRACSSAFERVFLTRKDMEVFHEPFGEPFYHSKERLSARYEDDEEARKASGHSEDTYKTVFDQILEADSEGKRVFLKDMAYYLTPPDGKPPSIAPSLMTRKRGVGTVVNGTKDAIDGAAAPNGLANGAAKGGAPYPYGTVAEPGNPTVVPEALLKRFHFTFLIRHPRYAIPSYVRCTVPPLDEVTGFYDFMPSEAGYAELVRLFDYLRSVGHVAGSGSKANGVAIDGVGDARFTNGVNGANGANGINGVNGINTVHGVNGVSSVHAVNGAGVNGTNGINGSSHDDAVELCVLDADDMLNDPEGTLKAYCKSVGLQYTPDMLNWDNEEDQQRAVAQFEKWPGFHDDALGSTCLKKREHAKKPKSEAELYAEWSERFGEDMARVIERTVEDNVPHYEYLKQFALAPDPVLN